MRSPLLALTVLGAALIAAGCEDLPPVPEPPNVPPVASFYFNPVAPINAGQTPVVFNAVASRDSDGEVVAYVWNFGDGTPEVTTEGPTIAHLFTDTEATCVEVTYGVFLTVVDDDGERGYTSQSVRVIETPAPSSPECTRR